LLPLLPHGFEIMAYPLAGQPELSADLGLCAALEVQPGDVHPVAADLVRRTALGSLAHQLGLMR